MPPPIIYQQPFRIEWATKPSGELILFKFDEHLGHFTVPPRYAAKRDEIVVLKATVNGNIGVDLPVNRKMLLAIDNLPTVLNPLAESAARDLLGM